jgi:hypothetical protein
MKNIICICFALCLISGLAFAESSKMTKVDLDVKTTNIIKADLGRDDLVYYIDTNACICWVSQSMGSSFAVATFDCSKLAAHPKLEKYVAECGVKKEAPKEPAPVVKTGEEVKKEEVKQPDAAAVAPATDDTTKDATKPAKDKKKPKK